MEAGGGRIHAIWLPSENLKLDFTIGYDYNDEGGYPYYYTGAIDGYDKENENIKTTQGRFHTIRIVLIAVDCSIPV